MTASFRFGILAPMPSELRPVVKAFGLRRGRCGDVDGHVGAVGGAEVVATTTGIGLARGGEAARRLLDGADIDHVVVVGIAGGIGPSVGVADVVVPEVVTGWPDRAGHRPSPLGDLEPRGEIVSSDEYGYPPETIAAFIESGVVAVDMETVAVGEICAERGVPWSAVRAISDRADDDTVDAAVLALARPDGSPDVGASARYLLRHPGRLPRLVALAKDATRAATAAARTAARACAEPRS